MDPIKEERSDNADPREKKSPMSKPMDTPGVVEAHHMIAQPVGSLN